MKLLFTILLSVYSLISMCQNTLTLHGRITDNLIGIDVVNPEIKVITSKGDSFEIQGDSSGNYSLTISLSYDTLTAIVSVFAENQMTLNEKFYLILDSDTTIRLNLSMAPQEVCFDSFLPSPLFFEFNSLTIKDSSLTHSLEKFCSSTSQEFLDDALKLKSGIVIYCVQGFYEKDGIAQKRAEYINELIKSHKTLKDNFEIEVVNRDDYFYCTHCDGCFEYYKYGQGINLDNKTIKANPQLDQLRQLVEIKWKGNKN